MDKVKSKLADAEQKAVLLFDQVIARNLVLPGKSENELNTEIFQLAKDLFRIEKFWHKRIVRSGPNTLFPYDENPPNLVIQKDDILFLDFGPIFEDWEADLGRTYVIGNDPLKHKLKQDIESAWLEAKRWFGSQVHITGAEFYQYVVDLAESMGWTFGGEIAGHLIGHFPHERLEPGNYGLYIHPDNHNDLLASDENGMKRHWILEIHFVCKANKIGGFFEQLLT